MKYSTLLAIESSCDETACAIVQKAENDGLAKVISSITATSLAKHKATKGIVPEVAAREQLKCILPVIEEALKTAQLNKQDIEAIAVTTGPGLVGSLLVGIETARALGMAWELPVIPVNHIQAHPYANFVETEENQNVPQFPLLSWVISGGHTDLYLMNSHEDIQHLGGTVDDAAGECFDKCARVLGFDYPGGPFIEKLSLVIEKNDPQFKGKLPRPLIHEKTFNMSFSGLKTAFMRLFKENQNPIDSEVLKTSLATELQEAVSDIIWKRTQQALEQHPNVKSVIVSGGVAANKRIREKLSEGLTQNGNQQTLYFPPLSLCTDNAAMIGAYASFHLDKQTGWENVKLELK